MNVPPLKEPELPTSNPSVLILLAAEVPLPCMRGPLFVCLAGVLVYIL